MGFILIFLVQSGRSGASYRRKLRAAIEHCDLRSVAEAPATSRIDEDAFDERHRAWCVKIIEHLRGDGVTDAKSGEPFWNIERFWTVTDE